MYQNNSGENMKKLLLLILITILFTTNINAREIEDLENYDMFLLNINSKLNTNNILNYFNNTDIIYIEPYIENNIKNKIKIIYKGNIENINEYYIKKINELKLLIDTSKYKYIPLNINKIKVYTTYKKINNLTKDYNITYKIER